MTEESPTALLESRYEDAVSHLEDGEQRIKAWYREDIAPPDGFPEINTAPHQRLIERGTELHRLASELGNMQATISDPLNDAELTLYGVGMERLLTGLHLQLDSESFLQTLEDRGETPGFRACKSLVIDDLSDQIPSEQRGMLVLVLKILWTLRNNEAHMGYHSYYPAQIRRLFLEVSCILQQLYADEEPNALEAIREEIQDRRKQRVDAARSVEFDLSIGR